MHRTDQELVAVEEIVAVELVKCMTGILQRRGLLPAGPALSIHARAASAAGGGAHARATLARGGGIAKKPIEKSSPLHAGKSGAEKFSPKISGVGPGAEKSAAENLALGRGARG